MKNYNTTLVLNASTEKVFKAITKELSNWWGKQDKLVEKRNDIFRVSWGEPWYQFEVVEYIENEKMIWKCIDANQKIRGLVGVEKEWVNSKIHWSLEKVDSSRTILTFEHEGLTPKVLCYNVCSNSWSEFLKGSLVKYVKGVDF